jgi:amidophosphoribosyltransferase
MARIGKLVAFQAAEALHRERGTREEVFQSVYKDAKRVVEDDSVPRINHVKRIYDAFSTDEISAKITELLTPPELKGKVEILFQDLEGLHASSPDHTGDWYFSGNYPTKGGIRVVNKAFVYHMEGIDARAY